MGGGGSGQISHHHCRSPTHWAEGRFLQRWEEKTSIKRNSKYVTHNALWDNIQRWVRRVSKLVRSVFISWLLPCCLSAPPLATGWRLGEVWASGRGASRSSSLLLLSSLPEALAESEELLLPVLLICSITSTSARNSASSNTHFHSRLTHPADQSIKEVAETGSDLQADSWSCSPLLMSSSWGSGEGLSFGDGEVLAPTPGLMGARNTELGWLERIDCCSIRAWILLLPSALKHRKRVIPNHLNQWLEHYAWAYLVFLTWMLLLSFSSTNSPVSWLMMSTQSFWYGRLFPLKTVMGGVEPLKENSVNEHDPDKNRLDESNLLPGYEVMLWWPHRPSQPAAPPHSSCRLMLV